jgi:hypothetical protein
MLSAARLLPPPHHFSAEGCHVVLIYLYHFEVVQLCSLPRNVGARRRKPPTLPLHRNPAGLSIVVSKLQDALRVTGHGNQLIRETFLCRRGLEPTCDSCRSSPSRPNALPESSAVCRPSLESGRSADRKEKGSGVARHSRVDIASKIAGSNPQPQCALVRGSKDEVSGSLGDNEVSARSDHLILLHLYSQGFSGKR